jgi:hypothetical protein
MTRLGSGGAQNWTRLRQSVRILVDARPGRHVSQNPYQIRTGLSRALPYRGVPSSSSQVLPQKLALPGGVKNGLDQEVEVTGIDAGDGVDEPDGDLTGEARGKAEHPLLPAGAGGFTSVQHGDRDFPVDDGKCGAELEFHTEQPTAEAGRWPVLSAASATPQITSPVVFTEFADAAGTADAVSERYAVEYPSAF